MEFLRRNICRAGDLAQRFKDLSSITGTKIKKGKQCTRKPRVMACGLHMSLKSMTCTHSVAGGLSLLWPQVPLRHPGMCGLGCRSRPRRPQLPRCFLSCHHAEGEGSSPARGLGTSNSDQMQQISRLCSFCIEKATTLIVFISVSLNENKLHFGNTIFVFLDTGSHY